MIKTVSKTNSPTGVQVSRQVSYLQQAAVTLLSFLHVQVSTARSSHQALGLRHVEQTHAAAVQQADGQVCGAAAAEQLAGHEPEVRGQGTGETVTCAEQTNRFWSFKPGPGTDPVDGSMMHPPRRGSFSQEQRRSVVSCLIPRL